MNPMAQPGTHPDADLLSAFAERALPEADRVRVMSHLAACARCREIAYLAHAAAAEEIAPAPAVTRQPGWISAAFIRWRVALIPAAALAAVGAVVLWVQIHPASRPVEMAQLATQPPGLAPAPLPQQAGPNEQKTESAAPRTSSASSKATAGERPREDRHKLAAARPPLPPEEAPAAFDSAAATLPAPALPGRAQSGIHLDGRSAAQARFAPLPPNGPPGASPYLPSQQQSAVIYPQARAALAAPTPGRVPAPPPPATGLLNVQGEGINASAVGPTQVAVQSLQQAGLVPQPVNGLPVLRLARRAKLPSGLNTVSSAVLLNRLVAIDSAGAVFLSQDGGKRWQPVPPQWSGKAIEVQAPHQLAYRWMSTSEDRSRETPPNPAQAPVETSQDNAPAPPAPALNVSSLPASPSHAKTSLPGPPMLFRLVTDHHQVWLSPDGKSWQEQ